MKSYIYNSIIESADSLFRNQPNLSKYTGATNEHEPNLSFHFAYECWKLFPWLDCGFDLEKPEQQFQRPDLVFHKNRIHSANTLVVELKRYSHNEVSKPNWWCKADERKIENYWFSEPLNYLFGVSLIIDEKNSNFAFALFERGVKEALRYKSFEDHKDHIEEEETDNIIQEIIKLESAKRDADADIKELEKKIDCLVYQLYSLTDEEILIVEGKD